MYVGGVNQAPLTEVLTPAGVPLSTVGVPFVIGNSYGNGDFLWEFRGQIKYVEAWNRILTDGEIADVTAKEGFGGVLPGLVFQGPCVRTKELDYFEDKTLATKDKLIDNMYRMIGTPNDAVVTRLI